MALSSPQTLCIHDTPSVFPLFVFYLHHSYTYIILSVYTFCFLGLSLVLNSWFCSLFGRCMSLLSSTLSSSSSFVFAVQYALFRLNLDLNCLGSHYYRSCVSVYLYLIEHLQQYITHYLLLVSCVSSRILALESWLGVCVTGEITSVKSRCQFLDVTS